MCLLVSKMRLFDMASKKADLILHPVRMQILKTIGGRAMTSAEFVDALPDVSRATLYRHINALYEGGMLIVVDENPIRGTVEKVYALADPQSTHLTVEDLQSATKDDHQQYFTLFISSLLNDFGRYLDSREQPDFAKDFVGYQTHALHVNDEEMRELVQKLNEVLLPFLQKQPSNDRKRLLFSTVVMPSVDSPSTDDSKE